MYWEIYATFSFITLSLLLMVIFRGTYSFFRFHTKYDLYLMLLLVFLVFPIILDLMRGVWLLILPIQNWDFLILWYGLSILATIAGIGVLAKLLFIYAGLMKIKIRIYWRLFVIATFALLILVAYYSLMQPEFLYLIDGNFTYRTIEVKDLGFNIPFLILIELVAFPFVRKFISIGKQMHTPRWRKRLIEVTIFVELLYFIIYFQIGLIKNWQTVVFNSFLEFTLIIFVLFIFLPRNQGEAMFMQINLESIYICEKNGVILYTSFFTEGKNRDLYGKLVWGLVESTTNMINNIRGVKHVGLGHILLDDRTAIIIEHSETAPLYYIVFTARYSNFTHEQVKALKARLDVLNIGRMVGGQVELMPEIVTKTILETFFV